MGSRHGMLFNQACAFTLAFNKENVLADQDSEEFIEFWYKKLRDLDNELWLITLGDEQAEPPAESAPEPQREAAEPTPLSSAKIDFWHRVQATGMNADEMLHVLGLSKQQFEAMPDASLPERWKQIKAAVAGQGPEPEPTPDTAEQLEAA